MNVDYIIVGCGLAGIAFCEQLRKHHKSYVVFDNESQQSSLVAAGMYNPVILKRFSEVWKAQEQLDIALPYYKMLEDTLDVKLDYRFPIYRCFSSIEEQNTWFAASDNPKLEPFLSTKIQSNTNPHIDAPFGFGKVLSTGRIDTNTLILAYRKYLKETNQLIEERFDYELLKIEAQATTYKNIMAKRVVFCEGFGLQKNPFFSYLPLNAVKGEILTIEAPELQIDFALKAAIFVIPERRNTYTVGATYNWEDKTHATSQEAREELVSKLKSVITCDFKVINQVAGIRPTVKDRRPLVGKHSKYNNLFILNGLGTRGVMIAPYVSEKLYDFIENNEALADDINISRF